MHLFIMYTYTKFPSLHKTWATWQVFSKFCNIPEDTSSTYCQFLNVWIQQSQSETNGLMSAAPVFDLSDRWPALSLSIANLASGRELTREDTRVSAFALRLLSVWIHARPHSGNLLSLKTGLSHRALILIWSPPASRPLLGPPGHQKVTTSATFLPS